MLEAYLINYVTADDYNLMMESAAPDFCGGSIAEFAQPTGQIYIGDLSDALMQIIDTLIADDFRDNEREPGDELKLTAERVDNNDYITYSLNDRSGNVYAVVSAQKYEIAITLS